MDFTEFLAWEAYSRDTIDFKKAYVDIAGDLVSGLLLSQIIYWYLPSKKDGKSKLRVYQDGYFWIAKKRTDWWDEIRITTRQFDRAVGILEKKDLVVTGLYKFDGSPTKHIRLNTEKFLSVFTQSVKSNLRNGKIEITQSVKSLTEITTKTTKPFRATPVKDGGFTSKHAHKKLHKLYFGFMRFRREDDPDFQDPRLYHPALRLWRGVFQTDLSPKGNWRDRIIKLVGEDETSLKLWRKSMEVWTGISTNKNAPLRVQSIYENGGVLDDIESFRRKQRDNSQDNEVDIPDPLSMVNLSKQVEGWKELKEMKDKGLLKGAN